MKILAEKEAENFLRKEGFDVLNTIFISKKDRIKKVIQKIGFPFVMKVCGKKILHKNRIGGVKIGIRNYKEALQDFNLLMKIKDSEGVLLQKKIRGREYLLGIKSAKEFGHVIAFGLGGIKVEETKKVAFRICPVNKEDVNEMIKEIKIYVKKDDLKKIQENMLKLCSLTKKYPNIKELDINPLILDEDTAKIVDARMIL